MHTVPLVVAFLGLVSLFLAWVALLVRHEEQLRVADTAWTRAHLTDRGPVWTAPAAHVAFAATASSGVTSSTVSAIDTSTSRPPTVRAGSFCRVPGSTAQNRRGDTMVCSPASDGRPRWRRALELALSA